MRKLIYTTLIAGSLLLFSGDSFSQCAMCRRVAETGHSNDNSAARGLNRGILYLLAIPYVMGGIGIFAFYRNKRKH
jgi:hypothetical protein